MGAWSQRSSRGSWLALVILCLWVVPIQATREKGRKDNLDDVAFSHPGMWLTVQIEGDFGLMRSIAPRDTLDSFDTFLAIEGTQWTMDWDRVTGMPNYLEGPGIPWIPGTGVGNTISGRAWGLQDGVLGQDVPVDLVERRARDFMARYPALFGASPADLALMPEGSGPVLDYLYYLNFEARHFGIPVENSRVTFVINHGNLIQVGQEFISPALEGLDPYPSINAQTAWEILWGYLAGLGPYPEDEILESGRLTIMPMSSRQVVDNLASDPGKGLEYRLAFVLVFRRPGNPGTWEARVDAHTGELLAFKDSNQYGRIHGGAYMGDRPVAETDRSFPYANYSGTTTYADAAGNFPGNSGTSTLNGRYVTISSNCGATPSLTTSSGDLNFGMSAGLDCTTPGVGGAGNTHAARTQYLNVTLIKMKALTYLPSNTWLAQKLTDNVNLTSTVCNANWNGTSVNFYQSGGGCWNTGELLGVSLHEFAHGLDANDGNGSASEGGTGEIYGDVTAMMQTHDSCMGRGFMGGRCSGYTDACADCTGVREADYMKHASKSPHFPEDVTSDVCAGCTTFTCPTATCVGPCNRECHCEAAMGIETAWDLATRDLISWGMDPASAWQLVDRLWFASRPTATGAYVCSGFPNGGCAANTMWRAFRAVDDDNGSTNDGTPHSTALYAAFSRHKIACATDAGYNTDYSACGTIGTPGATATPSTNQVVLNWTAASGVANYYIYRNEVGCDQGYTYQASVPSGTLTYTDTLVANGVTYYYRVQAVGTDTDCRGAMSYCTSATPLTCTPLTAPGSLTATPNGNYRIDLTWGTVGSVVNYNVYRATVSGGPYTLLTTTSPSVTAYSDTAVYGGTTYYYVVRAFSTCESVNSNQASATAAGTCNKPPTFAGLASAANGLNATCRVVLTWAAGASSCGGTLSYNIYRSSSSPFTPAPGFLIASGVSGTTFTDTGASFKKTYYYLVRALDSVSGLSDSNTAVLSAYPTGASTTVYTNDFEANMTNWTTGSTATPGAVGALTGTFERGDPVGTTNNYGSQGQPETGHNSTNCVFTDQNTVGSAGVDDVDYGEQRLLSPAFSVSAYPAARLDYWAWFLNDHNSTLSGCSYPDYGYFEVSNDGGSNWTVLRFFPESCATETSCGTNAWINYVYNIEDYIALTSNMVFRYRLADHQNTSSVPCEGDLVEGAIDDFFVYGYATCTACTPPAVPTGFTATAGGANTVNLAWSGSASRYNIYRSDGACPGGTFVQVAGDITGTSWNDTSVSGGSTYSYKVSGLSATYCESALTACDDATASGTCTNPPAFAGLDSVVSAGSDATCGLVLTWGAATASCGGAITYDVHRSSSPSFTPGPTTLIKVGATSPYTDNGDLLYGGSYYYLVRAKEGAIEEANSVVKLGRPSGVVSTKNVFFNNFDSGTGMPAAWDKGSFVSTDTTMADVRGAMACSPPAPPSGANVFRWGGTTCTGNYTTGKASFGYPLPDVYGVKVPFDATGTQLSFSHRWQFGTAAGAGSGALFVFNLPSVDGNTWTTFGTGWFTGTDYNGTLSGTPLTAGTACWNGTQSTYTATTFNLETICQRKLAGGGCADQYLGLGFCGASASSGTMYDGWFFDDLTVSASYGNACATGSTCSMVADVTPNGTTTVNPGQDILFTLKHTEGKPPYAYQWTENGSNIAGATGTSYAANKGVAGSFTYNCKVTDSSGRCADIGDAAAATGTWQTASAPPQRVAYSATPTLLTTVSQGANGTFTWDVGTAGCTSTGYHILYGPGASIATLDSATPTVAGSACAIGTAGTYTWNGMPSPAAGQFIWFLIVGDDGGTTEGSWGLTYPGGLEEGRTAASGQCSCATRSSNTCPTP